MKNLFSKKLLKNREVIPNINDFMQMNEKIIHGIFWGVSVVALILSVVNLKENVQISKTTTEIMETSNSSDSSTEGITSTKDAYTYEDLDKVVSSQLGESVSEYISEYITENNLTKNFTEENLTSMQTEISNDLIERLKEVTTINEKQEVVIKELVSSMISEIEVEKIDYDKIDSSIEKQVTKLVEEKAEVLKNDKYDDNALKSLIAENEADIANNAAAIDDANSKISGINDELSDQSQKITGNSTAIASNKSATESNASNIAQNQDKNNEQDDKLASNSASISDNSKAIKNNTASIEKNASTFESYKQTIINSDARSKTNENNIRNNTIGINKLDDKILLNTAKINATNQDISSMYSRLVTNDGVEFEFAYEYGVYGYRVNGKFYPF